MRLTCSVNAQPHILKWDFEATVYNIEDPHDVFADVRLGDKCRGPWLTT